MATLQHLAPAPPAAMEPRPAPAPAAALARPRLAAAQKYRGDAPRSSRASLAAFEAVNGDFVALARFEAGSTDPVARGDDHRPHPHGRHEQQATPSREDAYVSGCPAGRLAASVGAPWPRRPLAAGPGSHHLREAPFGFGASE